MNKQLFRADWFKFPKLSKVIKHILTEDDNETYDTSRTLTVISFFVGVSLSIAGFVMERSFDLQGFAIGSSALIVGLGLTKRLEPKYEPMEKETK